MVTGASGFIGSALVRSLNGAGVHVVAVVRHPLREPVQGVEWVIADLLKPRSTQPLLRHWAPAVVFNLAGYGVDTSERDAEAAKRLNAMLPAELAEVLAETASQEHWAGPRLIHVGSAFEYGSIAGRLFEETSCRPHSLYAETKLAGTLAVAEAFGNGLHALTARVPMVYGPGEHEHRLLPSLLRLRSGGKPLSLTRGEQERDFTFVDDVVEGLCRLAALRAPAVPVVNLGTGHLTPVRRFVELALDILGLERAAVHFGALPYRGDEVRQGPLDLSRLQGLTGWTPSLSPSEGLRRTVAAWRTAVEEAGRA